MIEQRTVPGVYIKELNAFPNSVVEVATALPVFIGYTQTNSLNGQSFLNKAVEINSLNDYLAFFENGPTTNPTVYPQAGPQIQYTLAEWTAPTATNPTYDVSLNGKFYNLVVVPGSLFYMYNSIQLFFQNGGATCYVVSIGSYKSTPQKADFLPIFDLLKAEQAPTLIVMPDALLLNQADYYTVLDESLSHCSQVQSRMTLMDMYAGDTIQDQLNFLAQQALATDPISIFRNNIGINNLNYGAAYYPWVNTNVVPSNNITYSNLQGGLATFATYVDLVTPTMPQLAVTQITKILALTNLSSTAMHNALLTASPNYNSLMSAVSKKINCLPVASAIAGAITMVDSTQGVWKAPANVSLNSVQSAVLNIDDDLQSNMNVDAISGKSVNAIRFFTGQGVLIWGARTLDGNSQDWRYLSVRRTLIMIEQSIKLACRAYVFANNDANTWLNLQSMIENFLTDIWKQGGLAGSKPAEAFSVSVGLGSTMTAQDILNGYLDIAVLVAVTHPAEFIEITFKQELQQS